MPPEELAQRHSAFRRIDLSSVELDPLTQALPFQNFGTKSPPHLRVDPRSDDPARGLTAFLTEFQGRVLIAAESAGRREMLLDILRNVNVNMHLIMFPVKPRPMGKIAGDPHVLRAGRDYPIWPSSIAQGYIEVDRISIEFAT